MQMFKRKQKQKANENSSNKQKIQSVAKKRHSQKVSVVCCVRVKEGQGVEYTEEDSEYVPTIPTLSFLTINLVSLVMRCVSKVAL